MLDVECDEKSISIFFFLPNIRLTINENRLSNT